MRTALVASVCAVVSLLFANAAGSTPGFTINATETFAFSGLVTSFSPADLSQTDCTGLTATIDWGDGSTDSGVPVVADGASCDVSHSHTYTEDGSYTVGVHVTNGTTSQDYSGTAVVGEQEVSLTSSSVGPIPEGTAFSGTLANFTDPGSTDPASSFSATIDWGDGTTTAGTITGSAGSYAISGVHTYSDEGAFTISITALETSQPDFTLSVATTMTVTEGDSLSATPLTLTPVEGAQFSGTVATFKDTLDNIASDFTATIDWGDGFVTTGTVSGSGGPSGTFSVSGDHTYAEEGTFTATVTLSDDAPGTATATAASTVKVADAPLTASGTSLIESPGSAFTATVAHFTDADPNGVASDYSATIDWGDGTAPSAGTVVVNLGGGFDVNGSHTYTGSGSKTITVKINDAGGSSVTAISSATLPLADLAVSIGATPNPVKFGTTLTYKLQIKNGGPTGASNVVVNDALPAQVQFASISSGGLACLTPAVGTTGTISCNTATLANGASATVTVTVIVVGGGKTSITATATVNSDSLDPNPANNSASVTTNIYGRK
jgi:uncharacterized repeat protein (TIGR01451 family)